VLGLKIPESVRVRVDEAIQEFSGAVGHVSPEGLA
jgi:hypothetical protein